METLWFIIIALMLTTYVVLDGFDLGAGVIYLLIARTPAERRMVIRSIGPVWDGNEVWLLASGGTLYFAFPQLYASAFSGFYLPLMMVLWLLILRGIGIELRAHIDDHVWQSFFDFIFCGSSALLTIFFGAALGNVLRGVPLGPDGYFFEPLWTNFRVSGYPGILDWYTILVGVLALAVLVMHGALWVRMKTSGPVSDRAAALARQVWWAVLALAAVVTAVTFQVQPQIRENLTTWPLGLILPLLAVAGLAGVQFELIKHDEPKAFFASCLYITGMLTSVVFGLFPMVLPARNPVYSLTVNSAKAADYGLKVGLIWWIVGMILATTYFTYVYRSFAGKVVVEKDPHGHS